MIIVMMIIIMVFMIVNMIIIVIAVFTIVMVVVVIRTISVHVSRDASNRWSFNDGNLLDKKAQRPRPEVKSVT